MKKFIACLLVVALFIGAFPATAFAGRASNFTYTYSEWGVPIPSPDAYRVTAFILGEHLGIGHFNRPQDLHVHENFLYVVDSGNNRIVVLEFFEDSSFEVYNVITYVMIDGQPSGFNNPHGIFVSDWAASRNQKWIADTFNQRVIHVDENWEVINVIGHPAEHGSLLYDFLDFLPHKLAVDF